MFMHAALIRYAMIKCFSCTKSTPVLDQIRAVFTIIFNWDSVHYCCTGGNGEVSPACVVCPPSPLPPRTKNLFMVVWQSQKASATLFLYIGGYTGSPVLILHFPWPFNILNWPSFVYIERWEWAWGCSHACIITSESKLSCYTIILSLDCLSTSSTPSTFMSHRSVGVLYYRENSQWRHGLKARHLETV